MKNQKRCDAAGLSSLPAKALTTLDVLVASTIGFKMEHEITVNLQNALSDWMECNATDNVRQLEVHKVIGNRFLLIDRINNVGYRVLVNVITPIDGKMRW